MLRGVSAIVSPSGREEVIQVPVMACANCGEPHMADRLPGREKDENTIITGA